MRSSAPKTMFTAKCRLFTEQLLSWFSTDKNTNSFQKEVIAVMLQYCIFPWVCFCQKLAKSDDIWQSYHKNKRVTFFLRHSV